MCTSVEAQQPCAGEHHAKVYDIHVHDVRDCRELHDTAPCIREDRDLVWCTQAANRLLPEVFNLLTPLIPVEGRMTLRRIPFSGGLNFGADGLKAYNTPHVCTHTGYAANHKNPLADCQTCSLMPSVLQLLTTRSRFIIE